MPRLTPDYPGGRKPPRFAYLRSFLPLLFLLLLFSFGLVSYSLLSHFRSPAAKQHIGWQSWDIVEISSGRKGGGADSSAGEEGDDEDAWWEGSWSPSLPLDDWDPLSMHTTGLTEITVKACYFPAELFPSYCAPDTTPEEDKAKGRWVRVEKDLNLRTGLWYLNVYYRRTRRLDVPLITSVRVVSEPPPDTLTTELEGWIKAAGDLHSGVWPSQKEARIWYKTRDQDWKKRQEEVSYEYGEFVTELDVVYGSDDPFFGFERVQGGPVTEGKEGRWESVDLALRRGTYVPPKADEPRFHEDGTFKIMQIADLHYSVGNGECKDTDKEGCVGDPDTATWLGEALDAEKPDLVVFSGDQLNGQQTSYDSRSVLAKFAKPVIDRQIPWCAIMGNHDSEIAEDRALQLRMLASMPYSLTQAGPSDVDGEGNYLVKIFSGDLSKIHLFTLYFLDSHAYQKKKLPWQDADYDYLKTSQIDWFLNASANIDPIERPFTPDGTADLGHIWSSSRRSPVYSSSGRPRRLPSSRQSTRLAKPNAMMWFHIPLPEAYDSADVDEDGNELDVGTEQDGHGSSKHNSGFFYNAVKETFEVAQGTGEGEGWFGEDEGGSVAEVKVLSHGHTHNTDRCRRVDGIWMCFDGGSSFSGYGKIGFDRRVRIYELKEYGETIETYKRLSEGDVIDKQVLVGTGAPSGAGMDKGAW